MDGKSLKEIVGQNIYYLRTVNHLTQLELGEKLHDGTDGKNDMLLIVLLDQLQDSLDRFGNAILPRVLGKQTVAKAALTLEKDVKKDVIGAVEGIHDGFMECDENEHIPENMGACINRSGALCGEYCFCGDGSRTERRSCGAVF